MSCRLLVVITTVIYTWSASSAFQSNGAQQGRFLPKAGRRHPSRPLSSFSDEQKFSDFRLNAKKSNDETNKGSQYFFATPDDGSSSDDKTIAAAAATTAIGGAGLAATTTATGTATTAATTTAAATSAAAGSTSSTIGSIAAARTATTVASSAIGGSLAATGTATTTTATTTTAASVATTSAAATAAGSTSSTTIGSIAAARTATTVASTAIGGGLAATTATGSGTTTAGTSIAAATSAARTATVAGGLAASTSAARTATVAGGVAATAAASGTSTTVATGSSASVGGAVAARTAAAAGVTAGTSTRLPYYLSSAASTRAAVAGGSVIAAVGSEAVDGGVGVGSMAVDALTGGGAAADAAAASSNLGALGDALLGAGGEMVGDAAALITDATMDAASAVGTAVVDATVGIATDAAIGTGITWGVWDGIQRIIPKWLFSGGAVILGGEVLFAVLAFFLASSALGNSDEADGAVAESTKDVTIPPLEVSDGLNTQQVNINEVQAEATPDIRSSNDTTNKPIDLNSTLALDSNNSDVSTSNSSKQPTLVSIEESEDPMANSSSLLLSQPEIYFDGNSTSLMNQSESSLDFNATLMNQTGIDGYGNATNLMNQSESDIYFNATALMNLRNQSKADMSLNSTTVTATPPARTATSSSTALFMSSGDPGNFFEYEYVPSGEKRTSGFGGEGGEELLSSTYSMEIPASMRGEAVRSALRSSQCIGWTFSTEERESSSPPSLDQGFLTLHGPGCVNFLNNQLSQKYDPPTRKAMGTATFGRNQQAAFLTPKGRIVDELSVNVYQKEDETAYAHILTSPGHKAQDLFNTLDKYIFPLDEVTLECPSPQFHFTLASCELGHVDTVFRQDILPELGINDDKIKLPSNKNDRCLTVPFAAGKGELVVWPTVSLPDCAGVGYTFGFHQVGDDTQGAEDIIRQGKSIWEYLISEANSQGPVEIGALEYESLRIEAGQPRYGREMLGDWEKKTKQESGKPEISTTPPSPFELFQEDDLVNLEKGCYRGQEGVASVVKNPRGPPRALYQVVFDDEFNVYDYQTENDSQATFLENETRVPRVGDSLAVLGSNDEIMVGVITSMAEPASTGDSNTVGLSLIRRADSILSQMKERGLSIDRSEYYTAQDESGMIMPPPRDPLDGLEVIVQGSFAVGTLRSVPTRRTRFGQNMFMEGVPDFSDDDDDEFGLQDDNVIDVTRVPLMNSAFSNDAIDEQIAAETTVLDDPVQQDQALETETVAAETEDEDEEDQEAALLELKKAEEEAAAAAAEAQRKAEKMELLRKRAEEAMARKKKNQKKKE